MTVKSPAWKPQARFALVTCWTMAASSPSVQWPKLSPMSVFRSTRCSLAIFQVLHTEVGDEHVGGRVREHQVEVGGLGRGLGRHAAGPVDRHVAGRHGHGVPPRGLAESGDAE